jgi:oxygen-independent coproporphyrinogen-3 oxidase
MKIRNSKPEALYLHVPFCHTICYYCDFAHQVYRESNADAYLQAVGKELVSKNINPYLQTAYIGGGTPTALTAIQLDRLLSLLDPYVSHVKEYTIEVNPESLDEEKIQIFRKHQINRVSIGMQTGDDALLKKIGRHHTFADTARACRALQKAGITNLSLDLMYSLPGQTMEMLESSVQQALSLHPAHLSLYSLTVEENTVFGKQGVKHLDEDSEADMYEWICKELPEHGFHQYEISNFARPGKESLHNSMYWNYRDFYGIGPGASGKEGLRRYDNVRSLQAYLEEPGKHDDIPLSKEDAMFEMVMMGMRFKEGMDLSLFEETFGISFAQAFGTKAQSLYDQKLIENRNGRVKAAGHAYEILNTVLEELL